MFHIIIINASLVTQSRLTFYNILDCSLPGFSVHKTFQARILEWVAISFFRRSYRPMDQNCISSIACISGRFLTSWAIGEALILLWLFLFLHAVIGCSLMAQSVKSYRQCRRPTFDPWVGKIPWRRKWQPTPLVFPAEFHG